MPCGVYSKDFELLNFGIDHPLQPSRFIRERIYFKTVFNLKILEPKQYSEDLLKKVHSEEYIRLVKKYDSRGFGALSPDTPVFPGIYKYALACCWATLTACDLVMKEKVVYQFAGGWHHARRDSDGGFCVFNDAALALVYLKEKGLKPAYVDIDAHAGDGVMYILYEEPILKISIHQDPLTLYPGCGFIDEWGRGKGLGYMINIPLPPYSGDEQLVQVFSEIVIPALKEYKPDVIILQAGVDGHRYDPLTALEYSAWGYKSIAEKLKKLNVPIVLLSGGGYHLYVHVIHGVIFGILIDKLEKVWEDAIKIDPQPIAGRENVSKKVKELIRELKETHPFISTLS